MNKSREVALTEAEYWATEDGFTVSVGVRNDGDRTLLVSCGVRQIQFDASTGQISIWFSDHGRDPNLPGGRCRLNTVPRTIEAKAGEQVQLHGRMPQKIRRLTGVRGSDVQFEVFDVSAARGVDVHVAVAETPFYFNPSKGTATEQLRAWGEDLSVAAKLTKRSTDEGADRGAGEGADRST